MRDQHQSIQNSRRTARRGPFSDPTARTVKRLPVGSLSGGKGREHDDVSVARPKTQSSRTVLSEDVDSRQQKAAPWRHTSVAFRKSRTQRCRCCRARARDSQEKARCPAISCAFLKPGYSGSGCSSDRASTTCIRFITTTTEGTCRRIRSNDKIKY